MKRLHRNAGKAKAIIGGLFRSISLSGVVPGFLLLPLFLLLLAACAPNERVAGGDDFPNSVKTLGKSTAEEGRDSTEWNAYKEAPDSTDGLYDTTYVPDTVPREGGGGLSKRSVADIFISAEGIIPGRDVAGAVRAIDTLLDVVTGVTRTVRVQSAATFTVRDTTWHRRDSLGRATVIRVAGVVERAGGARETFVFEDGDGDGVLTARADSSTVVIRLTWNRAPGDIGERTLRMTAGPDRDFNRRADNVLLAFSETRFSEAGAGAGADTLLHLVLRDADGDGFIFNPLRDSNLVDVERVSRIAATPETRQTLSYRLAAFTDPARNRAVRFRRVLETGLGTTETVALGRDSLPDFAPGDTGFVRVLFTGTNANDSLARSESVYRVRLSDTAGRHAGNTLLRVDREKSFRFGARTGLRSTLWPTSPVPDGDFAQTGSLALRLDLQGGGWVRFSGDATRSGFSGVWTNDRGDGGVVHYDVSGAIVSAPSLSSAARALKPR